MLNLLLWAMRESAPTYVYINVTVKSPAGIVCPSGGMHFFIVSYKKIIQGRLHRLTLTGIPTVL